VAREVSEKQKEGWKSGLMSNGESCKHQHEIDCEDAYGWLYITPHGSLFNIILY
jgi:hypothetical protein